MNQVIKIGTVLLSAGFLFVFVLLYPNNHYGNIFNIFSNPLEFTSKKLFCSKNIREAFGSLAYGPEVTSMGLFVNYPSFLPDLDET